MAVSQQSYLYIYYINREQSHRTEIQIMCAQTKMTNEKYSNYCHFGDCSSENVLFTASPHSVWGLAFNPPHRVDISVTCLVMVLNQYLFTNPKLALHACCNCCLRMLHFFAFFVHYHLSSSAPCYFLNIWRYYQYLIFFELLLFAH